MEKINLLLSHITANLFGIDFKIVAEYDKVYQTKEGHARIYLQAKYTSACTETQEVKEWSGRKWYLSEYMTEDEIVKTAWCAFEKAVQHEVMEAFKFDGVRLFNPHVNYLELLSVSHKEIRREN